MNRSAQLALIGTTTVEYATPQWLFDELDAEFGFTLDVCASLENAKCERYFTIEQDGLKRAIAGDWRGEVCWMNPPYGREIKRWVWTAWREATHAGAIVVGLLPARTDTAWWHDYIEGKAEVRFIRGRLRFRPKRAGGGDNAAPFPSAIVIWRAA
jgi:phage N-6-adenine-methyltransferase